MFIKLNGNNISQYTKYILHILSDSLVDLTCFILIGLNSRLPSCPKDALYSNPSFHPPYPYFHSIDETKQVYMLAVNHLYYSL